MTEMLYGGHAAFGGFTQDLESMVIEKPAYLLTKVLDDTCRCDDHSVSSVQSVEDTLSPLPQKTAVVERSPSALSAPSLHVICRSSPSLRGIRQPVRRTQTISGHVTQPPGQFAPLQQSAGFSAASE